MTPDLDLLNRYACTADAAAFAVLVDRHAGFVFIADLTGISQTTARRRCEDGIERLRGILRRMGVAGAGVGLGALLLENSALAAPASLRLGLVKIGMAGVGQTVGTTAGTAGAKSGIAVLTKLVCTGTAMKTAVAVVGVTVAIGLGVAALETRRAPAGAVPPAQIAPAGVAVAAARNEKLETRNDAAPAGVAIAAAASPAQSSLSTDWPCWRGPTHDGIAPASPKLLDPWPKEGPKLLWKSEPIPAGSNGGAGVGSPVVADGQVFVYVNWRLPKGGKKYRFITADVLAEWDWREDVPEDLAKKVEAVRLSDKRKQLKNPWPGPNLDEFIKDFLATLDPKVVEKYEPWIRKRINGVKCTGGAMSFFSWPELVKLAALQDREFDSVGEFHETLLREVGNLQHYGTAPYLRAAIAKASQRTDAVVCLDAGSGKEYWRQSFPAEDSNPHDENGYEISMGACSTPAIADGRCYAVGSSGLYCLDIKNGGALVWKVKTRFSNSSPLVMGGVVYVGADPSPPHKPKAPRLGAGGALTAFQADTGEVLWRQPGFDVGHGASVVPWVSGGMTYLIGCGGAGLVCIDSERGHILWQVKEVGYGEGSSTPAISGDIVVFTGRKGDYAFKITPQQAEPLWRTPPGPWRAGSVVIYQDHVYCGTTDYMRCLALKTGEVKWMKKEINSHHSSPILADGKIIFATGDNNGTRGRDEPFAIVFKATPERFAEVGKFATAPADRFGGLHGLMAPCASPAFVGGRVYLRLKDCVACYDLTATGK